MYSYVLSMFIYLSCIQFDGLYHVILHKILLLILARPSLLINQLIIFITQIINILVTCVTFNEIGEPVGSNGKVSYLNKRVKKVLLEYFRSIKDTLILILWKDLAFKYS